MTYIRQCVACKVLTDENGKRTHSIVTLNNVPQVKCAYDCTKKTEPKRFEVDREKMEEVTEKGIEQGFENAHEEWRAMALDCLHKVCLSYDTFTVNDVRALVERSPLKTHDNRAMGGIIKTGQREGWLAPTGESIPSVVGHKVHIQIWKSLIYKQ